MKPLHIEIDDNTPLTIIPDSEASADGHLILTYTYSIFKDRRLSDSQIEDKKSRLHLEFVPDDDYLGYVTFSQPGNFFTYTANGSTYLNETQVELLIHQIGFYRNTPSLWLI